MRDKIWFMVLVLGLIASIAGGGLALVNKQTKPIIENRILEEGIKPSLAKFFKKVGADNDYIKNRIELDLGKDDWGRKIKIQVFKGKKGDQLVGLGLQTAAAGFGGDIFVLSAFDIKTSTILGVKTLDQKETKGLGSRVADDSEAFIKQFAGQSYLNGVRTKSAGGTLDVISGATVSSNGFTNAVNNAATLVMEKQTEIGK